MKKLLLSLLCVPSLVLADWWQNGVSQNTNTSTSSISGLGSSYTPSNTINGLWVDYWTTNSLSIWPGFANVAGKILNLSTTAYLTVTTMTRSNEMQYVYINQRNSTTEPLFYSSTNVPIYATNTFWGWYNPATNVDRCIGGAVTFTNNYHLRTFGRQRDGTVFFTAVICAAGMNPDGTWQTPNIYPKTSLFYPVMATEVLCTGRRGNGSGGSAYLACSSLILGFSPYYYYTSTAPADINETFWVTLDSGRDILIQGSDIAANILGLYITGYKEVRQ